MGGVPPGGVRCAALLRGVNVGGKNIVSMGEVVRAVAAAGLRDVRTLINSGNVLFTADTYDGLALARRVEEAIATRVGARVPVLVVDLEGMQRVIDVLNVTCADDRSKCDVLFLFDDVDNPAVIERLPLAPGLEDVRYVPGAVIWRIDRDQAARTRMTRIVGTPLYRRMTIRNANTVRRLHALMCT